MDTTIAAPASCEVTLLQRYWEEGDEFLDRIVTGNEIWVKFVDAETKEQSKKWMHTHSPPTSPRNLNKHCRTEE